MILHVLRLITGREICVNIKCIGKALLDIIQHFILDLHYCCALISGEHNAKPVKYAGLHHGVKSVDRIHVFCSACRINVFRSSDI